MHINNGYACVFRPGHHKARQNGYVYVHYLVAEKKLGRKLRKGEIVHHIDGDRLNNDPDNIRITSRKEHAHIHKGYKKKKSCELCGKITTNKRFCSDSCSQLGQRKVRRPSKKELEKMIWKKPATHIANEYGVSSSCVAKWCRIYGIVNRPGRGYWQKALCKK